MAEPEKAKADRHQKLHEKRQAKRERTSDTPEATAERAKSAKQYDQNALRKLGELGERTGVFG